MLNLAEQKTFTLRERTLQQVDPEGARIQTAMNMAFRGHSVMEPGNIRAGRDLGNCLVQLLHLRVEKIKALIE